MYNIKIEDMKKAFNEVVKDKLKDKGVKQRWLANELGISDSDISKKLINNNFRISEIYHIKDLLDIKDD